MSSAGHVFDMMNRMRQVKEEKQARHARQQKIKDAMYKAAEKSQLHEFKYEDIPPAELARIKETIRREAEADRKKEALKSLLVLVPLLLAIVVLVVFFLV